MIKLCRDFNKGFIADERTFIEKLEKLNDKIRKEVDQVKDKTTVELD